MFLQKWTKPLLGAYRHVLRLQCVSRFERVVLGFYKILSVLGYVSGLQKPANLRETCNGKHIDSADVGLHKYTINALCTPAKEFNQQDRVAVVVPSFARTYNDSDQLKAAIQCLQQQTRLPDYLIVIDDCSPIACTIPSTLTFKAEVVKLQRNRGPAAARNVGIARAFELGASMICFMDADCLPGRGWVKAMVAAQMHSPGIVSGCTISSRPDSAIGRFHDVFGTLNGRMFTDGSLLYGCTCNMSVSFTACPLRFDEDFRTAAFEDVDFCYRARQQGVSLTYCKDAEMRHQFQPTLLSFLKQFHRYARAEHNLTNKHATYLSELWDTTDISPRQDINPHFCAAA